MLTVHLLDERKDIWDLFAVEMSYPEITTALLPKDAKRRNKCKRSFIDFCKIYCSDSFYNPNPFHFEFCKDLEEAILSESTYEIKKAIAAPRGIGKSHVVRLAIIWAMLYGHRKVAVVICATGTDADQNINSIKSILTSNYKLEQDFPEIITWIQGFEANAQKAQSAGGKWSADEIKLNNDSACVGRGYTGKVRGISIDTVRPDLVIVDDLEDEESVKSETQTNMIHDVLEKAISNLHESGKGCSYVKICTILTPGCVAAQYTNPKKQPSWSGKRYKAVLEYPKNTDLWDRFGELISEYHLNEKPADDEVWASVKKTKKLLGLSSDDWNAFAKSNQDRAARFYAGNFKEMNEGARLLDPVRIPLHRFYFKYYENERGKIAALCELQNDPPESEDSISLRMKEGDIKRRRSEAYDRFAVPEWADLITVTIDTGLRRHHWECNAFDMRTEMNVMIACGVQRTGIDDDETYELGDATVKAGMVHSYIERGLQLIHDRIQEVDFVKHSTGDVIFPYFGVDRRGGRDQKPWYATVIQFCNDRQRWFALRGEPNWSEGSIKRSEGLNFFQGDMGDIAFHADAYKDILHRAYEADFIRSDGTPLPRSRALHRSTPEYNLESYCRNQVSEYFDHDKNRWVHEKSKPNHWWDTAVQSYVMLDLIRTAMANDAGDEEDLPMIGLDGRIV